MNAQSDTSEFALSTLHAAAERVRRVYDAAPLNEIVNHPAVRPHIGGSNIESAVDLSGVIQDTTNIALHDDGAAAVFSCLSPGLYEVHSFAVPERRGRHAFRAAQAFLHLMFTRTAAIEVVTRVPEGNLAALGMARANGFRFEFQSPMGWVTPEGKFPVKWYRLGIQDWAARAPGLVERGRWFHEAVEGACHRAGVARAPHPEDETHNRYAGMASEMILGGMLSKGLHFLNRYGAITRAPPVVLLSTSPLVIHIGDIAIEVNLESQSIELVKAQ